MRIANIILNIHNLFLEYLEFNASKKCHIYHSQIKLNQQQQDFDYILRIPDMFNQTFDYAIVMENI